MEMLLAFRTVSAFNQIPEGERESTLVLGGLRSISGKQPSYGPLENVREMGVLVVGEKNEKSWDLNVH